MRPVFLYPSVPFSPGTVDDTFASEADAMRQVGFQTLTVSIEDLEQDRVVMQRPPAGSTVVYRGWMLGQQAYLRLVQGIESRDAHALTDLRTYLSCHHLPNWYPLLQDLTAQTVLLPLDADLKHELERLGWDAFFLKDHVKSLKTGMGSVLRDPGQAPAWLAEMERVRGLVEGGVCVRRVESYRPNSEQRFFVIQRRVFANAGDAPTIVLKAAQRIPSAFFSVDLAVRDDGAERIIEIGDGQVSDLVGWEPERFAHVWLAATT